MIKKILFLFLIFSGFSITHAQFNSGIIIGLNLSKIEYDVPRRYEVLNPGGYINIPFNIGLKDFGGVSLSLQPELIASMKGAKYKTDTSMTINARNYAELPLMFKIRFGRGGFKPYINFGPYFAWHAMYYDQTKIGDEWFGTDPLMPDYDVMNMFDYGANAGIGFNSNGFIFEVRYGLGFNDIVKGQTSINNVLSICIGILVLEHEATEAAPDFELKE